MESANEKLALLDSFPEDLYTEEFFSVDCVRPTTVNPVFPSPLRRTIKLSGKWEFLADNDAKGSLDAYIGGSHRLAGRISVPGAIEGQARAILAKNRPAAPTKSPGHICWSAYERYALYKRRFRVSSEAGKELWWLKFGCICPAAKIWLNGTLLGYHHRSMTAFKLRVDNILSFTAENTLDVMIDKADASCRGGYPMYSGMFRSVEVEGTQAAWIEDVRVTPRVSSAVFRIDVDTRVTGKNSSEANEIEARAFLDDKLVARRREPLRGVRRKRTCRLDLKVRKVRLWTDDSPSLYRLEVLLVSRRRQIDSHILRAGLRELKVTDRRILVNNDPVFLRGHVDDWHSIPHASRTVLRKELRKNKAAGFNHVRFHNYFPFDEYLDVADELGILVYGEVPIFANFGIIWDYDEAKGTWENVIRQSRNHPCLLAYSLGNEAGQIFCSSDIPKINGLHDQAKKLAPSVLFCRASGIMDLPAKTDLAPLQVLMGYTGLAKAPWNEMIRLVPDRKPVLLHEHGKLGVFPDPTTKHKYDGTPVHPVWLHIQERKHREKGLDKMIPIFVRNSRYLSRQCWKIMLELPRHEDKLAGYQNIGLRDTAEFSAGLLDDFGNPHIGRARDLVETTGATVLLIDHGFTGRSFYWGSSLEVDLSISHYDHVDLSGAVLSYTLSGSRGILAKGRLSGSFTIPKGNAKKLGRLSIPLPERKKAEKLLLTVELKSPKRSYANKWDFWGIPRADREPPGRYGELRHLGDWIKLAFLEFGIVHFMQKGQQFPEGCSRDFFRVDHPGIAQVSPRRWARCPVR